jgi:gas vesicle protein GvpK/gas vesicle protein GvpA/GvpJ/GvpM family
MATPTTATDPAPPLAGARHSPAATTSLAEVLDRILHCGVSLDGNLTIGLANVDLDLRLLFAAVDTVWPQGRPPTSLAPRSDPEPLPPPALSPDRDAGPNAVDSEHAAIRRRAESLPAPKVASAPAPTVAPPSGPVSGPASGPASLVLTLVRVLHELLERLAVRRMEGEQLTAQQIEDVGAALLAQAVEIDRLRQQFGFSHRDLALGFGLSERTT